MARLVAQILLLTSPMIAAGAQAAGPPNAWHVDPEIPPSRSFDIPDQVVSFNVGKGSRIFAGRELIPNGVLGVGMFGPKADKSPHSAATARDLSMRKARKAAVGFSLKF